ncbi:MAG: sulfatase [Actinomycetota bacterium]
MLRHGHAALALAVLIASTTSLVPGQTAVSAEGSDQPNWVVVMTDDQDVRTLDSMPIVRRELADQGITFTRAFATFPYCCPSRATFLTGQYPHNHEVWGNKSPAGFDGFRDAETLPVWLERAGYRNAYVGKYLNGYGLKDPTYIPPGWWAWNALTDPTTYWMYGSRFNDAGVLRTYGTPAVEDPRNYQTDVITRKATTQLRRLLKRKAPFLLVVMYVAPHAESVWDGWSPRRDPRPAARHEGVLAGKPITRPLAYNEADVTDKPASIQARWRFGRDSRDIHASRERNRRESLLAVDEGVGAIIDTLRESGRLDSTNIAFTSDNGFLLGQHRIPWGKFLPYEPSARVPLILRGPAFPRGVRTDELVANQDLTATILETTGVEPGLVQDGRSLLPFAADPDLRSTRPILLESTNATDEVMDFALEGDSLGLWTPYVALRTSRFKYVQYSGGDRELYDLLLDPGEKQSRHDDPSYQATMLWLASTVASMRSCSGWSCNMVVGEPPAPG